MKRVHIHVTVAELGRSVSFYSTLFGAAPVVLKDDYAKWMLDDPRVNFAISDRAQTPGVDHLGIQVETSDELAGLAQNLQAAGELTRDQTATTCCYAKSDKSWVNDPDGIRWESFLTHGASVTFGENQPKAAPACC